MRNNTRMNIHLQTLDKTPFCEMSMKPVDYAYRIEAYKMCSSPEFVAEIRRMAKTV